jgi:hypothetical protein
LVLRDRDSVLGRNGDHTRTQGFQLPVYVEVGRKLRPSDTILLRLPRQLKHEPTIDCATDTFGCMVTSPSPAPMIFAIRLPTRLGITSPRRMGLGVVDVNVLYHSLPELGSPQ